jgi:hypothetical protein
MRKVDGFVVMISWKSDDDVDEGAEPCVDLHWAVERVTGQMSLWMGARTDGTLYCWPKIQG